MSVRQIDEALHLWNQRLNAAAQNLVELQAHPVYKRISAPDAALKGETAERAALAVQTLSWLLQYFDSLQSVIARADDLRRTMPALFGQDEREREIAALLNGRTVQLPAVQVPFGQRTLLGGMQNVNAISPADLLRVMESAFEQTKQIVLQLDAAWENLGRSIDGAAQRVEAMREVSQYLNGADRAALEQAGQTLAALQQVASQDPLGASSRLLSGIDATLQRLSGQLDSIRREREEIRVELNGAQQLLASVQQENKAAHSVCEEAREKTGFTGCVGPEQVASLESWFRRLQEMAGSSSNDGLLAGLRNWTEAAKRTRDSDRKAAAEAQGQLSLRSELRGRLDALKAKARAYSLAEHDTLQAIAERAKSLLYTRPTPLSEAAACVAEYEAKLNFEAHKTVRK